MHDDKITYNEIVENLRKKKNKSSPGEDGISYKLLKHAGKNFICGLARLFTPHHRLLSREMENSACAHAS